MPHFTNKNGFSPEVVKWLLIDEYDYLPGVLSATGIMDPIRKTVLKERYRDKLEIDVEAFIDARIGTSVHSSFEKVDYSKEKIIQEERYFADIDNYKISGKPDMLIPVGDPDSEVYRLRDIKTTSVWSVVYGDKAKSWSIQLSIYKYILHKNDIKTMDIATMLLVLKDWSRRDAANGGKYPRAKIHEPVIELLSLEDTEDYLRDRLQMLALSRELEDDELPLCTEEELWFKPGNDAYIQERDNGKFAHMREGGTRAIKLYDTRKECLAAVDKDCLGTVNRCPGYCSVHPFCNQFKEMKEKGLIPEEE